MAESLLDPFWQPEIEPTQPAELPDDVVSFRPASNMHVSVELFRRATGTFGFHYRAWVAWRDAGGGAERHGWHEVEPDEGLITDDLEGSRRTAEHDGLAHGIRFAGPWQRSA